MARRSTSWRPFWTAFPILALIPIIAISGHAIWSFSTRLEEVRRSERFAVNLQREAVARGLFQVAADVCILADQNELAAFLADGESGARAGMAREYLALSRNARIYDQIRYLDDAGREVVRVNANDGVPSVVPEAELQDKAGRYYFAEALAVDPGQIYVSPLDLNIERGVIEVPHKPMIRVGTSVVDGSGRTRGVVLINFLAQTMLGGVEAAGAVSAGHAMMMNNEGYWFVTPNPPPRWGFMFPEQSDDRMPDLFPAAWDYMNKHPRGDVRTEHGLFTYDTYFPLEGLSDCPGPSGEAETSVARHNDGYRWVLASRVPESTLARWRRGAIVNALIIGVPVLILLAVGTRAVSVVVVERRRHRQHLESLARFDSLTGLANRVTFTEHLDEEVLRAKRYDRRFAVLYMDLDGFKTINDTLGHEVGDQVLIDVAAVLTETCRAVDVPARYGGDEFVVLLSEVTDVQVARGVATKVLDNVRALSWAGRAVGASIGLALWPEDSYDAATVVRLADEAMYAAKAAGKNRICLARDLAPDEPVSGG
ncbi:diguanylate cyclase [Roseospira visakhapatnamensis]|uniref:Diguanylate cyclase (GGDEF)-like protein n=1 Tax=Roseospira visakhapatnamensis TaxID=390880 RepID=A0A7W6RE56_9PROT|nr:diguanylate cyclase [Roseospira visakhapatnamensis]MBB4266369.1 diguanylate cyclase (GGDEF)-like protein [Roseospira visakhapatnamensis]